MSDELAGGEGEKKWDGRRVLYRELDSGAKDPLPEFVETVADAMEDAGNEVGRPCVMKVTVEVVGGRVNQDVGAEDA